MSGRSHGSNRDRIAAPAPPAYRSFGWAQATGPDGATAAAWLQADESCAFTAAASIRAVEETLTRAPHGAVSPAAASGADFALTIPAPAVPTRPRTSTASRTPVTARQRPPHTLNTAVRATTARLRPATDVRGEKDMETAQDLGKARDPPPRRSAPTRLEKSMDNAARTRQAADLTGRAGRALRDGPGGSARSVLR
jgi:hypothetical protein